VAVADANRRGINLGLGYAINVNPESNGGEPFVNRSRNGAKRNEGAYSLVQLTSLACESNLLQHEILEFDGLVLDSIQQSDESVPFL